MNGGDNLISLEGVFGGVLVVGSVVIGFAVWTLYLEWKDARRKRKEVDGSGGAFLGGMNELTRKDGRNDGVGGGGLPPQRPNPGVSSNGATLTWVEPTSSGDTDEKGGVKPTSDPAPTIIDPIPSDALIRIDRRENVDYRVYERNGVRYVQADFPWCVGVIETDPEAWSLNARVHNALRPPTSDPDENGDEAWRLSDLDDDDDVRGMAFDSTSDPSSDDYDPFFDPAHPLYLLGQNLANDGPGCGIHDREGWNGLGLNADDLLHPSNPTLEDDTIGMDSDMWDQTVYDDFGFEYGITDDVCEDGLSDDWSAGSGDHD